VTERKKTILRFIIAAVILVISMYFAVKDIDYDKFRLIVLSGEYWWLLATIPVSLLSHWIRAARWKTMLEPILGGKKSSTWNLFSAVMIGYAVNNVIPRGGEFLRPYVYSRREKISFSSSFATIIAERFIDVIILLLLFGGVFFFFRDQIVQALPEIHAENFLVPTLLILIVLILSLYPPVLNFILKYFVKPISAKLYDKLNSVSEKFVKGFEIIKMPHKYLRLIIESLAIWLCYTIPLYIAFYIYGFQNIYNMDFYDAILLIVVSGIGTTIAPTPGAIGVYQLLIQGTLVKIYNVQPEQASAYAWVTWFINYVVQVVTGGLFFLQENIKKIPKKEDLPVNT
jgi:glycosyltransferase 2 family protein